MEQHAIGLIKVYMFKFDLHDYYNGRSKRYWVVEFESPESQKRALEEPQHIIEGRKVCKWKLRTYGLAT